MTTSVHAAGGVQGPEPPPPPPSTPPPTNARSWDSGSVHFAGKGRTLWLEHRHRMQDFEPKQKAKHMLRVVKSVRSKALITINGKKGHNNTGTKQHFVTIDQKCVLSQALPPGLCAHYCINVCKQEWRYRWLTCMEGTTQTMCGSWLFSESTEPGQRHKGSRMCC